MLATLLLAATLEAWIPSQVGNYLEAYFRTFPSRATETGRHDLDARLESLPAEKRAEWLDFNVRVVARLSAALSADGLAPDDRLDAGLLLRQAERVVFEWGRLKKPERDPLFWTGILANAHVHLLIRDDLPREKRLASVRARALEVPALARQAREALSRTHPSQLSPELFSNAAGQARATAAFYRDGLGLAASGMPADFRARIALAAAAAAKSLDDLARFLDATAQRATGSARLGPLYAESFRTGTGLDEPVDSVLAAAEAALAEKRTEAAAYGRSVWKDLLPGEPLPGSDAAVLGRLFGRIAEDRAKSLDEFVEDYRTQVAKLDAFLRKRAIVPLPDPLTLWTGPSPSYFAGQAVGGVYPAGPFEPEAKTLWFLPTPPDDASPAGREAFFRDFNHHFNVMITPHEILPGHYLQLKWAARQARKVRALFPDDVYVEGWGTFCERLLLDLGWGGPLDRLAHLKKQMENIARTVVDVRVHTKGMTREEVLRFVRQDALQDERFAANMWVRAITTSPQITTYWLGYRQVMGLYEDVRRAKGDAFSLRAFLEGMLAPGPVPVKEIRARMLPDPKRP